MAAYWVEMSVSLWVIWWVEYWEHGLAETKGALKTALTDDTTAVSWVSMKATQTAVRLVCLQAVSSDVPQA